MLHGVLRVDHQIEHDLLQLRRVRADHHALFGQVEQEFDRFGDHGAQDLLDPPHLFTQIERAYLERLLATEREQLAHELARALRGLQNDR